MLTRRLFCAGALALGGGAFSTPALRAAPLDKIKAAGILRVAVYKDFEPWSWRADGKMVGIDVDLGQRIATELGVKVDFLELMADESVDDDLRNAVWRGTLIGQAPADIMLHVPFDRTLGLRNDRVALVAPYYRESFQIACNTVEANCDDPPVQLHGKRIAVELDTLPDIYLMGQFGGALRSDVRHYPTGPAALDALAKGDADAAMATRAQIEHGLAGKGDHFAQRRTPLPAMPNPGWDIGAAVKDDSRDLGDKVEAIMADLIKKGELESLFSAHNVVYRPSVSTI
ncbi:MAG: transporter substrate-binding domain-containing protein [Sphingobium sp.]|nr:transporter substrate-binding domain-containing protein [Sphingobium sp.]